MQFSYQKTIPVIGSYDVLVVGGGPAGLAAAIASGRNGARTALVERYGFLGGNATASLVGPFMTSFSGDGRAQIIRGIFDELVRRMEDLGGAIHPSKMEAGTCYSGFHTHGHAGVTPFDPETLKVVAAEMVLEAGVTLYLHTSFVDPMMDAARLTGAIVHSKSGLQALAARVVVDCSGDADVAFRAGVPMMHGRTGDGAMQPMTMFFRVGHVDQAKVEAYVRADPEANAERPFGALVDEARSRGEFPIERKNVNIYLQPGGRDWRVNVSRISGMDGTKVEDLTRAEVEGRKQVRALMTFLRRYLPGFEDAVLLETAAQVGVRETRRITGEYVLTADDLKYARHFPDVVALGAYPIDIHPATGDGGGLAEARRLGLTTANAYEIPYGTLVPHGVEQLLVAGRCLSATHEAAGATRVMSTSMAVGQAAGTAAALAATAAVAPRHIDVRTLQATLSAQGAVLEVPVHA